MSSLKGCDDSDSIENFNIFPISTFGAIIKDISNQEDKYISDIKGTNYFDKNNAEFSRKELDLDKKILEEDKKLFVNNAKTNVEKIILPKPEDLKSEKSSENKNSKIKSGRKKRKRSPFEVYRIKPEHNKFSDDNMQRKCKHLVLKNVQDFINTQIINIYNGKIGNGLGVKKLKTNNQFQKSDATTNFNKQFLTKTLANIFSEDISSRFTNYPKVHNKSLISRLMNEKDINKKIYFNKLFNLNFIQCLKHFGGVTFIRELNGLKLFSQIKNDILRKYPKDGEKYYNYLGYYIENFEEIINNKKSKISIKGKEKQNE